MSRPGLSLRTKITGAFLVPTLLIILMYGSLSYFASRQGLEDELGRRLGSIAQTVAAGMNDGVDAEQLERIDADKTRVITRLREKLVAVQAATGVARVFLFKPNLESVADTRDSVSFGQTLHAQQADRVELERLGATGGTTSVLFRGEDGAFYKTGYAPVLLGAQVVAIVGVEASASYFDLLNNAASVLTGLGALCVLLVILVGTWVGGRITRPVNALVDEARRLGRGDYAQPIALDHREQDELAILGDAFEDMRKDILNRDQQLQMMLSGIAHEVRNPLGGMKLFAGMLEEDLRAEQRDDHLDKVGRIQRELSYLDRVVTDFLDFARNQSADVERFRAADLLSEVDDLLGPECRESGAKLNLVVEPETVEVTADRQKLRRAVINCVRNAYQACGEDGRIVLAVHEVNGQRWVSIEDNGRGIAAEELDNVLTPFFTTKEKGTGLGLSLTRRIVEEHGGELEVTSELGKGTKVTLKLPFDDTIEAPNLVPEGWLG
ncbi:MAG: HAMP domain-containing sensor histidine kinase [bacterium]